MDLIISLFLLIIGLFLLFKGADVLVESSVRVARHFGISELVIGITLVALGTSLPELAVSSIASLGGHSQLAISNVIGSSVFNIFVVIGIIGTFVVYKVKEEKILDRDAVWCMLAALWLTFLCFSGEITQLHGFLLISAYLIYLSYLYVGIRDKKRIKEKILRKRDIFLLIISSIALYIGGQLTVDSAANIAATIGISQWLIGATIIAIGTSLPEAAASFVALKKRKYDISLGNIIGSNVFNILIVVGVASALRPLFVEFGIFALNFMFLILSSVFVTLILIKGEFHRKIALISFLLYGIFIGLVLAGF